MDFPSLATVIATLSVITYGVVDRVKAAVPRLNTWQVTAVSAVVGLVMRPCPIDTLEVVQ